MRMNQIDDDLDTLFGGITAGLQADGKVIIELKEAPVDAGLEYFAGTYGFANADAFYYWMQLATGSALSEWHGIYLRLYWCDTHGFQSWWTYPEKTARVCRPVDMFCLRHNEWTPNGLTRAYLASRERSYYEAVHLKARPGEPITPQIMMKSMGSGLMLTGIRPGESTATVLDWPSLDMTSALDIAKQSAVAGVREIKLSENGIAVALNDFTKADLKRLIKLDQDSDESLGLIQTLETLEEEDNIRAGRRTLHWFSHVPVYERRGGKRILVPGTGVTTHPVSQGVPGLIVRVCGGV